MKSFSANLYFIFCLIAIIQVTMQLDTGEAKKDKRTIFLNSNVGQPMLHTIFNPTVAFNAQKYYAQYEYCVKSCLQRIPSDNGVEGWG